MSTKCLRHRYRKGYCTNCGRKQGSGRKKQPKSIRRKPISPLNQQVIKRIAKQVARGASVSAATADAGYDPSVASHWMQRAAGTVDTSQFTEEHLRHCQEFVAAIKKAEQQFLASCATTVGKGVIGDLQKPAKRIVTKENDGEKETTKTVEEYRGANPELALKVLEKRDPQRWGPNQQITVSQQGKVDHVHHIQSLPQNDLKALENVLEGECERV